MIRIFFIIYHHEIKKIKFSNNVKKLKFKIIKNCNLLNYRSLNK